MYQKASEITPEQQAEYDEQFKAVMRFQAGDESGAVFMLEKFADFLEGFFLLIRGQRMKQIGLARSMRTKAPMPAAFGAAESAMTTISIQVRPIDDDDLRQEMAELFIAMLRRYRSINNQNFLIPYILKSFPYALSRRVRQIIKDPLVNLASDKILSLHAPMPTDATDYGRRPNVKDWVGFLTTSYEQSAIQVDEDELGNAWLRGESCHQAFENLTYSERKIIRSFYHLQKTDAQIAYDLGVSYNTAIRRRHHIEQKLHGRYTAPTCRWCHGLIPKAALGRQPRQCQDCRDRRRAERQQKKKLLEMQALSFSKN